MRCEQCGSSCKSGVYCGRGTPPLVKRRFICRMVASGLGDSGTSLLRRIGTEHSSGRGWFASKLCPVVVLFEETSGGKLLTRPKNLHLWDFWSSLMN